MEENLIPSGQAEAAEQRLCARCKVNAAEPGYTNAFCASCRVELSRHPIPKWIWLFAGGIVCIMIIGMFRMPQYLGAAIHMSRAEKAIDARRYTTAVKELDKVLAVLPESKEAHIQMLIAAAYSMDMLRARVAYESLKNKTIDDKEVYNKIEQAMDFIHNGSPDDSLIMERTDAATQKDSAAGLLRLADSLAAQAPGDLASQYVVANRLYDIKAFDACEAVTQKILSADANMYMALGMMAALKRNQKKCDEALDYCGRQLAINTEDATVYAQEAKIEMKRNNDVKAAEYVKKALYIDSSDLYVLEVKALLDHYTGKNAECKNTLAQIRAVESDTEKFIYNRVQKIINGTEAFR